MAWNMYFLWAGLIIICLELINFIYQRKLYDARTIVFINMMMLAVGTSVSGIIVTFQENNKMISSMISLIPVTIVYLCNIGFFYNTLYMGFLMIRKPKSILIKAALVLVCVQMLLILSNFYTGFVCHPAQNCTIHFGNGYKIYAWGICVLCHTNSTK